MTDGKVLLGRIVAAHGIKGEVLIRAYTETADGLTAYGALSTGDGREIAIVAARQSNKGVIARVAGIADRNAAEALRGVDLFVERRKMPEPDDGAYYHTDLIGLRAVDRTGGEIGRVTAVENYGAGDILVVAVDAGGEMMVPFRDAFVPVVDVRGGRVVIVPPEMIEESE